MIDHDNESLASVQEGIDRIKIGISAIREMLDKGTLHHITNESWSNSFLTCGGIALMMHKELAKHINIRMFNSDEFAKLLVSKSRAYGAGPIRSWGELGVIIRIDSKVERLQNLLSNSEREENDEPIEDTVKDILGYCVLGYHLVNSPER